VQGLAVSRTYRRSTERNIQLHLPFDPGETIVEEAHTGNGLYIVLSGHVEVVKGLGTENARRAQNRKRYCAGQG